MPPPLPRTITSIAVANATTGASPHSFPAVDVSAPSYEDLRDSVEVGDLLQRKFGYRALVTWRSYVNGDGANGFAHMGTAQDIYAASLNGTEKRIVITYDGAANNVFTIDPVLLTVKPMFDQGNKKKVWIHDAGAGAPTTGYDDLGAILLSSPEFTVETSGELGDKRQCYLTTQMDWNVPLKDTTKIATIEAHTGDLKVAVDLGNTTYFVMDDVHYDVDYAHSGPLVVAMLHLFAKWQDPRTAGIAWPATPPRNFFGFEVSAYASAQTRGDVLTVT